MKRAGISRVAVEVIILVIGVALALLIFSPIGSYIFGALGRTSAVGGQTTISILSVSIDETDNEMHIFVKNLGPGDVDVNSTNAGKSWQVFIDGNKASDLSYGNSSIAGGQDEGTFEVNEVIELVADPPTGVTFSKTSSYTVVVYGPGGTQTEYLYRGG